MNNAFLNDYNEICCDEIYEFVGKHIHDRFIGYEEDRYCKKAEEMILEAFATNDSKVQFFIGGTSANLTMLSYMLRFDYEAIIGTKYAHIANHEGGAIEASGHKVLIADDVDGKIVPESIEEIYLQHQRDDHMVLPKVVYISNTTEIGTLYTLDELKRISDVCKKYDLYLYIDGARIFSALYSKYNDIKMEDYAKYADVFYIGGTKNGCMLGEACVVVNKNLQNNYMRHMKNKGAMLAKGSLIGLNFIALFKDELYKKLAMNANEMAMRLVDCIKEKGYAFTYPPQSNQIFVSMKDDDVLKLQEEIGVGDLGYIDQANHIKCVRFVTSFHTTKEDISMLEEVLKTL